MLKVGVIGAGHLGKIHIKLLKEIGEIDFIGFHDNNEELAKSVSDEYKINYYHSSDSLMNDADALVIVTPTASHYEYAAKAIKNAKHIFVEKPLTGSIKEAKKLCKISKEADGVVVQVGHVERFNPAFIAAQPYLHQPMFIEAHRLAQFNPRGTDVSVVLDLMIHDIDIILSTVNSNIKKISASGVAVVSETPDITNARIEFDNGCVANLTASRISMKNMRKTRFFQQNAYVAVDFLEKKAEVLRLNPVVGEADPLAVTIDLGANKGLKQIYFENPKIEPFNAIKMELQAFINAITNNTPPPVTIYDGYDAMEVAYMIIDKVKLTSNFIE